VKRRTSVPEGQQDHGRVSLPVSIGLCGLDQRFDLPGRQVLPRSKFGVGASGRRNCSIYFSRRDSVICGPDGVSDLDRMRGVPSLRAVPRMDQGQEPRASRLRARDAHRFEQTHRFKKATTLSPHGPRDPFYCTGNMTCS
jgi:hypothetical protein